MNRIELIERLMAIDPGILFETPYGNARNVSNDDIAEAWDLLDPDAALEDIRLLFLLDYSREVKAMSENFGAEITDEEAAIRAEQYFKENIVE